MATELHKTCLPGHADPALGLRPGDNPTARFKCQNCAVRLTALCSSVPEDAAAALGRAYHRRRVPAGQVIYSSDQKAKTFAIIVSGVVKLTNVSQDGRQQIVGLQFPSDFVGRPYSGKSNLIAEAASDLDLCCFSGDVFEGLMRRHPEIETVVLKRTLDSLDGAREWMFMLGRKTAQERVASLIHMIAEHLNGGGPEPRAMVGPCRFECPLSRTEMADCLGLRLETVSRQIANLIAAGVLAKSRSRTFEVRDMAALRRLADTPSE